MRIWSSFLLSALVAFNTVVEGFVYERQPPALPSGSAQPTSSTFAPVVVSTVFIQDTRPRPTDTTSSGSQTSSPQTPNLGVQSAQTNDSSLSSVDGTLTLSQGDVIPTIMSDVPVTAFFLVLFLGLAAFYIRTISTNRQLRLRFTLSAVVLTFCTMRVMACSLRIAWAVLPENETLQISEMISLDLGSLVIFMASALIAKRIVRQFALTSLSGSNWRLTLWWLSKLLPIIGSISSVVIIALQSVGTSKLANPLIASGTLKNNPTLAPMLVRAGIAWLFAIGALYMLSISTVVASTRSLSRRYEKLGLKLAVFFAGTSLLQIGQGFRLFYIHRVVFYVTGFTLEVLVVSIYAFADLDRLFSDRQIDSTPARYNPRRSSTAFDFFRDDVFAIAREAQRPTVQRSNEGGITIRKSLYISYDRPSNVPYFPGRDFRRPLSVLSEHSEVSIDAGRESDISEINFPFPGPSRPAPVQKKPIHRKPVHATPARQPSHAGSVEEQVASQVSTASSANSSSPVSTFSSEPGRGKLFVFPQSSPYSELSPYSQLPS